ncbi:hypothetical protein BBO99_00007465 [Phytophthora kernoviae]|uniref:START domain-containing protein n=1 Tax=Phytophthora kernoviae TaxID=325452 RepID=A0A3R7KRC8_9STRA|nr:hypothetical protein BBI17_007411 [Phytophthora kernoviae]RLN76541.1 hypothetical protein BBO99_00007465 [Phytophthora kernoviae]
MDSKRFTTNPFGELTLTEEECVQLVKIADALIFAKFEEYEEHLNNEKRVDLGRWKKFTNSGPTTTYLERKSSSPDSKLPQLLMVGPLPGSLDDNMFGLVNPTIEAMRIKSSYLEDFSAAAVLNTIIEPTVDEPFRSVVVKWMEIDIPGASIGIVRNRDYVFIESTGILRLKNGERVGYHLFHSVSFPQVHDLPNRVRGNMSFVGIFHQESPDRTDCRGTGIMDPGGDMIRVMAVMGMVQATMAGLKYSYCGQMKKLAWLLEQRHVDAKQHGIPVVGSVCVTCSKDIKRSKFGGFGKSNTTCKLCFGAVCGTCKVPKTLSFIASDLELVQRKITLTGEDRAKLMEIAEELVLANLERYEEHLNSNKEVNLKRWKKFAKSGPTTSYLERKSSSPNTKLPQLLMVGPLPGSLDDNMFGLVNPTLESMRIKSSYLNDFNAAAMLTTIVEPTVGEPFRSVVVKWMEIDIPMASIGIVRNRDYVYLESTGILRLGNGERVGYHLLHSVTFPQTHELPHRVRGNMSFCGIFHEEALDRTDCYGTGIMDPGGDMIRAMAVMGMVQATMAGLKYSYCGQMKKIAWLLEQRQAGSREKGTPAFKPFCVTCMKAVKASRLSGPVGTCKLCFEAVCNSCKISKKLSFIAPDLQLSQRKVNFCVKCMIDATRMDTQEAAREQFVYKKSVTPALYSHSVQSDMSTCSESAMTS